MIPGTTPSTPATEQPGASSGGGGVGIQAAVARAVVRLEDRQLALEPEHADAWTTGMFAMTAASFRM